MNNLFSIWYKLTLFPRLTFVILAALLVPYYPFQQNNLLTSKFGLKVREYFLNTKITCCLNTFVVCLYVVQVLFKVGNVLITVTQLEWPTHLPFRSSFSLNLFLEYLNTGSCQAVLIFVCLGKLKLIWKLRVSNCIWLTLRVNKFKVFPNSRNSRCFAFTNKLLW